MPQKPDPFASWESFDPFSSWETFDPSQDYSTTADGWRTSNQPGMDTFLNTPSYSGQTGDSGIRDQRSAWEVANTSMFPERHTVEDFKKTLRGWNVPESFVDAASYIPRIGDWTYNTVARTAASPLGIATLGLPMLGAAGKVIGGAMGLGFGLPGVYHASKEFIKDPNLESGLDIGMNTLMAIGGHPMLREGLSEAFAKPIPVPQPRLPGMEDINFNQEILPSPRLEGLQNPPPREYQPSLFGDMGDLQQPNLNIPYRDPITGRMTPRALGTNEVARPFADVPPQSPAEPFTLGPQVDYARTEQIMKSFGVSWMEARRLQDSFDRAKSAPINEPVPTNELAPTTTPIETQPSQSLIPEEPPPHTDADLPDQVEIMPGTGDAAIWRDRGYVPLPGARSINNNPIWVKGTGETTPARIPTPRQVPSNAIPITPGQDLNVPKSRVDTPFMERMIRNGWQKVSETADDVIFRRGSTGEEGYIDVGEILNALDDWRQRFGGWLRARGTTMPTENNLTQFMQEHDGPTNPSDVRNVFSRMFPENQRKSDLQVPDGPFNLTTPQLSTQSRLENIANAPHNEPVNLGEPTPIDQRVDVFNPRDGRTIQTFNSQAEADAFIAAQGREGRQLDFSPHDPEYTALESHLQQNPNPGSIPEPSNIGVARIDPNTGEVIIPGYGRVSSPGMLGIHPDGAIRDMSNNRIVRRYPNEQQATDFVSEMVMEHQRLMGNQPSAQPAPEPTSASSTAAQRRALIPSNFMERIEDITNERERLDLLEEAGLSRDSSQMDLEDAFHRGDHGMHRTAQRQVNMWNAAIQELESRSGQFPQQQAAAPVGRTMAEFQPGRDLTPNPQEITDFKNRIGAITDPWEIRHVLDELDKKFDEATWAQNEYKRVNTGIKGMPRNPYPDIMKVWHDLADEALIKRQQLEGMPPHPSLPPQSPSEPYTTPPDKEPFVREPLTNLYQPELPESRIEGGVRERRWSDNEAKLKLASAVDSIIDPSTEPKQKYIPGSRELKMGVPKSKYDELAKSAGTQLTQSVGSPRSWESFARSQLRRYKIDPNRPGLSMDNLYGGEPTIVYRDERGIPIVIAELDEHNGKRYVPNLAADRMRPSAQLGTVEVLMKIIRMDALRTSGIISENTANGIREIKRLVYDDTVPPETPKSKPAKPTGDEGFLNFGDLYNALAEMKDKIGEKIRNFFVSPKEGVPSTFSKMVGLPTAATTTLDFSMPFRQGFPMIFTPEWRRALPKMFKAAFSEDFARQIDAEIRSKPLFQEHVDARGNTVKSFAAQHGLKLIEHGNVSRSEYDIGSNWIENGGNIPGFSKAYRSTVGRPVRASNRAAATFLNHLRANSFEKLINAGTAMSEKGLTTGKASEGGFFSRVKDVTPEQAGALDPRRNALLAKEIADFVNTATGRAPMKFHIIPVEGTEIPLEAPMKVLKYAMFSPRGLMSKVRMMSPSTYLMASPFVRRQYLKALVGTGVAWSTALGLIKGYGAATGKDVSVNLDPKSSDFGKARIGNTRLDPGAGFQQAFVGLYRLLSGNVVSSATGKERTLGQGFRADTMWDIGERFMSNKLAPLAKFGYDLANASQNQPFHVGDRMLQMYIPLIGQDMWELMHSDPSLIPLVGPAATFGMGTQTYGRNESIAKFLSPKHDILIKGGGLLNPKF